MKNLVFGALAAVGLVIVLALALDIHNQAFGQRFGNPPLPQAGAELIVVPANVGDKVQMLSIVDPRKEVISVYHVDMQTGKIALRSVRKLSWDLQMTYMNNDNPLPQEIRAQLEPR